MSARRLLGAGAIVTVLGIAIAGTAPVLGTGADDWARTQQAAGGITVLLGWAALGWGIHRFGRERG